MQEALIEIVQRAGDAILEVYRTDFDVETKSDDSPLTKADLAAHHVIVDGLAALAPDIPIISEESTPPPFDVRREWSTYWIVDPLDGTKEFVNKNGEFTVNIALIDNHRPRLGVVGVPVRSVVYTGDVTEGRALRHDVNGTTEIGGRKMTEPGVTVVASRSHGGERLEIYLAELEACFGGVDRTPVGSSLKLCILAEGKADIYPRLGPTSEWDIAAAHAVLASAGGDVWALGAATLDYNTKASFLNPEFIAVSDGTFPWRERLPGVPAI